MSLVTLDLSPQKNLRTETAQASEFVVPLVHSEGTLGAPRCHLPVQVRLSLMLMM